MMIGELDCIRRNNPRYDRSHLLVVSDETKTSILSTMELIEMDDANRVLDTSNSSSSSFSSTIVVPSSPCLTPPSLVEVVDMTPLHVSDINDRTKHHPYPTAVRKRKQLLIVTNDDSSHTDDDLVIGEWNLTRSGKRKKKMSVSFNTVISSIYTLDRPTYKRDDSTCDNDDDDNFDLKTIFDIVEDKHSIVVDPLLQRLQQQHDDEKLAMWYSRYEFYQMKRNIRRIFCYYHKNKRPLDQRCYQNHHDNMEHDNINTIHNDNDANDKECNHHVPNTPSIFQDLFVKCSSIMNHHHHSLDSATQQEEEDMFCQKISKQLSHSIIYRHQRGMERVLDVDYHHTRQLTMLLCQSNVFIEQSKKEDDMIMTRHESQQQTSPHEIRDQSDQEESIATAYHNACRISGLFARVIGLADYYVVYGHS